MKRFALGEMAIVVGAEYNATRYNGELCIVKEVEPHLEPMFWHMCPPSLLPDYRVTMCCDGSHWLACDRNLKKIPPREEPTSMRHEEEVSA